MLMADNCNHSQFRNNVVNSYINESPLHRQVPVYKQEDKETE